MIIQAYTGTMLYVSSKSVNYAFYPVQPIEYAKIISWNSKGFHGKCWQLLRSKKYFKV